MSRVENSSWDGVDAPDVYVDFIGQEIRAGDYVVYATSQSSSAKLTLARVVEFLTKDGDGKDYGHASYDYSTRPATLKAFSHTWRLKVQPVKDCSYAYRSSQPKGGYRQVVLSSVANIVRADETNAEFEEYL